MNQAFESIVVKVITEEGFPMAVGGICLPGTGTYWEERFRQLASLCISNMDIFNIDYALARAIQNIADESLLIAGCSLKAGIELAYGESTGGVLGCPREAICSAPGACEPLPKGFSMYTTAGGPGLAALADQAETERAAVAVRALEGAITGEKIMDCMRNAGIDTYLLVFDGTGLGTHGCVVAASPGKSTVVFL